MSEEECARAIAYGMMAVEPGHRRAVPRRDGHRQHHRRGGAVRRRCSAAAQPTGPGPAPASTARRSTRKSAAVDAAVGAAPTGARDPLELLRRLGGRELAAMAGAILAARMRPRPGAARRLCVAPPRPRCCTPPTRGRSTIAWSAHRLGRAGPSRGCSSGSASGRCSISACGSARRRARRSPFAILKAAAACHNGMATFAKPGSAARLNPGLTAPGSEFRSITDRSGRCEYCA